MLWNTLPEDITSAPSLLVVRRKLKNHLFRQSYPDNILYIVWVVAHDDECNSLRNSTVKSIQNSKYIRKCLILSRCIIYDIKAF